MCGEYRSLNNAKRCFQTLYLSLIQWFFVHDYCFLSEFCQTNIEQNCMFNNT
jgi:hypothetical protein